MSPTALVLTAPEPGTVIAPIHTYSEEQAAQIEALREVGYSAAWPRSWYTGLMVSAAAADFF